jgi:hypothetical protein
MKLPWSLMRQTVFQIAAFALSAASLPALAQWQWTDSAGKAVFSDRAPPPEVPDKAIRKRPSTASVADPTPAASGPSIVPATSAASAAGAASPPVIRRTDSTLAAKAKQAEQAEVAQRGAQEARLRQTRADNCARAKSALAYLASGQRIARSNDTGEREVLDDAARALEQRRLQGVVDTECKGP